MNDRAYVVLYHIANGDGRAFVTLANAETGRQAVQLVADHPRGRNRVIDGVTALNVRAGDGSAGTSLRTVTTVTREVEVTKTETETVSVSEVKRGSYVRWEADAE